MILEIFPQAIKIPSEALVSIMDGNSVFICKDGKARAVTVKTGIRTDSEVQITEGLEFNDSLITTGLL